MVEHVVGMFQRMISHADAGAHMKFIEADLHIRLLTAASSIVIKVDIQIRKMTMISIKNAIEI